MNEKRSFLFRMNRDRALVRDLCRQYLAITTEPVQEERRRLWRRLHSLRPVRPLIYVRAFAWSEMPEARCLCADPFFRGWEAFFRHRLFWHSLNDDSIFEPWVTVPAVGVGWEWGLSGERHRSHERRGSYKIEYPIRAEADTERLRVPHHVVDEARTAEAVARVQAAIGDLIPVVVDRGPVRRMWAGDFSTDLGQLRGIEHFMLDMMDRPEWLHRLMRFLSDGVHQCHDEAEHAGDWRLIHHENQAMPYAEELPDPSPNPNPVSRRQLWTFMAAQEFTLVSPAMHEEFLLRFQRPILEHFGLVAYGCCEDLTRKIVLLRTIPNLRRIAVAPVADVARCAEQIGRDYVISYRPNPALAVSVGFDPDRIRTNLQRDFEVLRESVFDITLKDVETVEYDPSRVHRWVTIVRSELERGFGG